MAEGEVREIGSILLHLKVSHSKHEKAQRAGFGDGRGLQQKNAGASRK